MLTKIIRICDKVIDVFLVLSVIAMSLVVLTQVVFRYVFVSPLSWPEETTRLLLVWLTFLGGYVAFRENDHMRFDLIVNKISKHYRRYIFLIQELLIAIFLIIIIVEGTKFSIKFSSVHLTYVDISLGIFAYTVFPVAGTCMLFKSLSNIYKLIFQASIHGDKS